MVELKILDLNIHKYANLTPLMVEEQYIALKLDIKDNGQIEPVRVCRGLIYDGRHRKGYLANICRRIRAIRNL